MKTSIKILTILFFTLTLLGCIPKNKNRKGLDLTAEKILGNSEYLAISYGGYREKNRDEVPSVNELKDDMKILAAMGIKLLRTYNTQQFTHTANLLKAIKELKDEDPGFEMYVMLGAWIDCEGAWSELVNHHAEDVINNTAEINAAVKMANDYPNIVKIIAVGNEAMVHWATSYFVYPEIILKWVNYLKKLRKNGKLPANIWITSSDNYESWGGGADVYKTDELTKLIKAVDYISLHTYPFHDSHYNPNFWGVRKEEKHLSKKEQIDAAMVRVKNYAISQYQSTFNYIKSLGIDKPIHIGETGWSTISNSLYGETGSRAADEYKQKLYYENIREWTKSEGISCFFFEAFDEQWKDMENTLGSENHFGLINLKGEAKFLLWEAVDKGAFDGLTRNGLTISKTYDGNITKLMNDVFIPPLKREMKLSEIKTINKNRKISRAIEESIYIVVRKNLVPDKTNIMSYASVELMLAI